MILKVRRQIYFYFFFFLLSFKMPSHCAKYVWIDWKINIWLSVFIEFFFENVSMDVWHSLCNEGNYWISIEIDDNRKSIGNDQNKLKKKKRRKNLVLRELIFNRADILSLNISPLLFSANFHFVMGQTIHSGQHSVKSDFKYGITTF